MIKLMEEEPERFVISSYTLNDTVTGYDYWTSNGADCLKIYRPDKGDKWSAQDQKAFWKAYKKLRGNRGIDSRWTEAYKFDEITEHKLHDFRKWHQERERLHEEYPTLKDLWEQYEATYSMIQKKSPPFK